MLAMPILAENRNDALWAWRGPCALIVDNDGAAGTLENSGLFFRQTRFLHHVALTLFGEHPHRCSSAEVAPNQLEFTYVYPEKKGGGSDRGGERNGIRYRNLDLRLGYRVLSNGLIATLRMTNRWQEKVAVDVGWQISADFADFDEVHGERKQNAKIEIVAAPNHVVFRYQHPQLPFKTDIQITGGGEWRFSRDRLSSVIEIERHAEIEIAMHVRAIDESELITDDDAAAREARLQDWSARVVRVETPVPTTLSVIANKSMQDLGSLALLEGTKEEWLTPAAGLPVFQSLWARDSLTAAWQATVFDRGEMAEAVLCTLSRLQGTRNDPWRDEQPGRIIRGAQRGPLVRLNMSPFGRYYGDYASPFAFVFALANLYAWSGNKRALRRHFDAARQILDWAKERGDIDGDGYLEYKTLSSAGPKHQAWRDAENAVVYANGQQVEPPIATCEVQGYWFVAQQMMAALSAVLGRYDDARGYWRSAHELKERFNRDFWMADEQCVALGLDPKKHQIKSVTSNAAQTFATGIVQREHLPALVKRLFEPDMFSGWGIRTLSAGNPAYNPLSYHLGSVWPVENATFLFGLRRFGFDKEVLTLATSLYELASIWRGHRVPECIGGYAREEAAHPGAYPQANVPQAWNQSVFPILIQALAGLAPLASMRLLTVRPLLPEWLPEFTLRHVRVGSATVSLRFRREENGGSSFEVLEKHGRLRIFDQPPMESLSAGMWDRLGLLVKQLVAA